LRKYKSNECLPTEKVIDKQSNKLMLKKIKQEVEEAFMSVEDGATST
jgi:hypothetical protein